MRLTAQEREVTIKLAAAWDAFCALPVEHPDDTDEFRRAVHAAQAKVLMRPGRRQINEV